MVKGCIYNEHKIFIFGTPNMQLIQHSLQTYTLTCSCQSYAIPLNNHNIQCWIFILAQFPMKTVYCSTKEGKLRIKPSKGKTALWWDWINISEMWSRGTTGKETRTILTGETNKEPILPLKFLKRLHPAHVQD